MPIDAIPNVSENQVIVLTDWPGRSPKDIEDQITYPLSVALQSVAGAESVRGKSMFGFSFVQVTFADNIDFYWARSRVAEQLATIGNQLPDGTSPVLAPDATALGQIYYYVLAPPAGMDLAEVRSIQDYVVKYALQSVEGVAEVASIGGYVKQYQIEIDPYKLRIHELTLNQVLTAVRDSNIDVEMTGEVAPAVITAVSTTVISFLPVFFLTGRDYRLFAPLAWTKTFSLVASLIVAVLLVPPLARLFLKNPVGKNWRAKIGAIFAGAMAAGLCTFVWGNQIESLASWCSRKIELGIDSLVVTSTISLIAAAIAYVMSRERLRPVDENLVARTVNFCYEPTLRLFLRYKRTFLMVPILIFFFGIGAWVGLPKLLSPIDRLARDYLQADFNGLQAYVDFKHTFTGLSSDDWIALEEGSWFYMPSLYPAASLSQAMETLQTQDAMIRRIPEVSEVLGKIGRVESALDPAPAGMIETYIMLKPRDQWRTGMTEAKIWDEINELATLPGITIADKLQPIEGRVVMLQSGIKASMAIRVFGDTLQGLAEASKSVAEKVKQHPMVNRDTVSPDIVLGKPYIEFEVDRTESARYGMTVRGVNEIIESALGGKKATTTVEGRQRYAIQVRYQRDYRDGISELDRIPIVTNTGEVVPLGRLASVQTRWGPAMVNSEDARLVAHVAFAPQDNLGSLETVDRVMESLTNARKMGELEFPEGNYELRAVGSFENQIEANRRLMIIIPLVLLLNIFIIYLQFRRIALTLIVFAGIPVAFGGGMIALSMADVQLNTAVWVGFIALFGIAIDDGVVIATYLDQTLKYNPLRDVKDIRDAVVQAGLRRIRPCLMTTCTTIIALLPVLLATGRGADVARAMAIPVFGGMVVELITLFVVPVVYSGFLEIKMQGGVADERFSVVTQDAEAVVV